MNKPTLIIMAGGTGGHVFPGLAVANYMKDKGWHIEWIGTRDKMEADLVPKHGFNINFINIGGVRGKSIFTKLLTPFKLLSALFQSLRLLRSLKPKVVLGMGGYASGPGGIASWLLRIPLVIHEQNAVFGMTNRYLAKVAKHTLTGFDLVNTPLSAASSKGLPKNLSYVGNPIREGFFSIPIRSAHDANQPINILIVGGSLGALALNKIVPKVLLALAVETNISVKHQSGKNKQKQVRADYLGLQDVDVIEFIDNMEEAFAWSDIIICRAGALTVAEVAGAGRVAIFVPLPIAVDDHQTANAKYLSDKHAAILIPQEKLEAMLLKQLNDLCASAEMRSNIAKAAKASAHRSATSAVGSVIEQVSKINNSPSNTQATNKGQA